MRKKRSWLRATAGGLAMIWGFLLIWSVPAQASGNLWYDKYVYFESLNGNRWYNLTNANALGWSEAYLLQTYLNVYEASEETQWLDKFVLHVDTIIGNATDLDGDGYLGWENYEASPAKLVNGDFETASPSDGSLPQNWSRTPSTVSGAAYRSNATGDYNSGAWGVVLTANGATYQSLTQSLASYDPEVVYTLRVNAKTDGSAAKGKAYVYDNTTSTVLAQVNVDNTQWKTYEFDFITPPAGHDLQIYLTHQDYGATNGKAYFDNVKVSGRFPYIGLDGNLGLSFSKFIKFVYGNDQLHGAYLAKATSYLNFLENNIVPRWQYSSYIGNTWVEPTPTTGYYIKPNNLVTFSNESTWKNPEGILPYNHFFMFSLMLNDLYDVTGNTAYKDKVDKINTFFKNNLQLQGTGYKWKYVVGGQTEDVGHGNLDVYSVLQLFNGGRIFDGTDMTRFTNTLVDNMWNQSLTDPKVGIVVDGSNNANTTKTLSLNAWTNLSQFDPLPWKIAAEQYRNLTRISSVGQALSLTEILKWDPEKLVNRGFELQSAGDGTLPARWHRSDATDVQAFRDSANNKSGSYGATLVAGGTTHQRLYQNWTDYTANANYTLTFDGKADSSGAGGKVTVYNETAGVEIASHTFYNTAWDAMSFSFNAPANATDEVRVYIGHGIETIAGAEAHFDNVKLRRTGDNW
ncbi:hypothetical protein FE784_12675 [Paenibacillus hemerocallicola]|uniref:CBM-cenC domain-containing protein n=1 Tax=Paenibacillus hemerocallicola TaxID=1172614 RepID=A0A5C4TAE9_9BACL|nr:hypothetical protein [Paenibacillus hemerocallicola]TNJ66023.1 hypothetical protein FE784_12675 [Paenibacillus hemerocallicola]